MGTRGPKRQTRATLPVVLHWRHRSLRSPVHSVHKKVRRQLHEFPTASGYSTLEQQEGLNDSTSMQSKITCQWKAKTGKRQACIWCSPNSCSQNLPCSTHCRHQQWETRHQLDSQGKWHTRASRWCLPSM